MNSFQSDLERLYNATGAKLSIGQSADFKTPPAANIPIFDTALAAIIATLGIPFREPSPFTDEDNGSRRVRTWWVSDFSQIEKGKPGHHITEDILGGYYNRGRMVVEHPLHPMNPMRDAIDARKYWLDVKFGDVRLPREGVGFVTDSLRSASILKAHGYKPVSFTGRAFILEPSSQGVMAEHVLEIAQRVEGQFAPQWMHKVLVNLDILLAHMKKSVRIVRVDEGGRTMLLSADATKSTVAKFENLL